MKKILFSVLAIAMTAFTFTSCEDVPMPYDLPGTGGNGSGETVVVEPTGSGTAEDPFNVAGAVAYTKALGSDVNSDKEIYVKGIVLENKTTEETITKYGNMTFTIVDAGTKTPFFTAFQVYGVGKKKFTSADQIQAGQEVVLCGKVVNFRGNTPETVGKGSAYVVSINGEGGSTTGGTTTGEAKGDGTEANPYNIAGVVAFINTLGSDKNSEKEVYVRGKVLANKTKQEDLPKYGNMTFTMVDENTSSPVFTAFQVNGPNKQKFTSLDQIKEGQEVVVCGKVVNYKGNTPETVGKGASYVVSINGEGKPTGESGNNPSGETSGTSEGITINGTTVTLTNSAAKAGTETVTCVVNDLGITDKGPAAGTYTLSDGSTLTVAQGDGTTAPTYYKLSNGFRIYASNTLSFACKKTIAKIEFVCDSFNGTDYVGNPTATISFNGANAVYCNKNSENKGGVQLRAQKIIITYAAE